MGRKRSELSKIVRKAGRLEKKQLAIERAGKIEGETEEQELARKTRDLEGWLGMMTERQIEEKLMAAASQSENDEKENTSDGTE